MIAAVGLTDFFEHLVIGSECKRAKPFPDPYLNALEHFGVSAENAFAFEVSYKSCMFLVMIRSSLQVSLIEANTVKNACAYGLLGVEVSLL